MVKFGGSDATDIEICGSAQKTLPLYLNRQLIKILEDLKVPHQAFMDLQASAVQVLRATTLSVDNAAWFLQKNHVGLAARLPWLILELERLGWNFHQDDFLKSVLEIAVLHRLREMKYRGRYPVEGGATVYGLLSYRKRYRKRNG